MNLLYYLSDTNITYKLLTGHDEVKIEREIKLKKLNKNSSNTLVNLKCISRIEA